MDDVNHVFHLSLFAVICVVSVKAEQASPYSFDTGANLKQPVTAFDVSFKGILTSSACAERL